MNIFNIEIIKLVTRAASIADSGTDWADAWKQAYFELGGLSQNNSVKSCPLNGTRTLYEYGLLKFSSKASVSFNERSILEASKNGWYCYLALCELKENPELDHKTLWGCVEKRVRERFGVAPKKDQGSVKITLALFQEKLLNLDRIS